MLGAAPGAALSPRYPPVIPPRTRPVRRSPRLAKAAPRLALPRRPPSPHGARGPGTKWATGRGRRGWHGPGAARRVQRDEEEEEDGEEEPGPGGKGLPEALRGPSPPPRPRRCPPEETPLPPARLGAVWARRLPGAAASSPLLRAAGPG